ncbi:hypothetical protein ACFV7O_21680 [Streptomyces tendae]|uniref:hypothetical protein n=1 Tax=Streptomyces tendae TaxID=1932 RepID=UPI0036681B7A
MLRDSDRPYIALFAENVPLTLEECPGAETSLGVLFGACLEATGRSDFMPLGTFERLLVATGYRRTPRAYGRRVAGLRLRNPALHNRSFYWKEPHNDR